MWSRTTSRETLRVRSALDDAAHALGSTLDDGQRAAADVLAARRRPCYLSATRPRG
ncbi:hypothetical protein [Isoptericola sp. NPDC019482]|uniref:hypothetical protein n=1 Tax=Isoptericola sp. NPDC019482 TaxID=3154688 RepID=UPI00347F2733